MYLVGNGMALMKSRENSGGETYLGINAITTAKSMEKNRWEKSEGETYLGVNAIAASKSM